MREEMPRINVRERTHMNTQIVPNAWYIFVELSRESMCITREQAGVMPGIVSSVGRIWQLATKGRPS
jgi:hypothetical protein